MDKFALNEAIIRITPQNQQQCSTADQMMALMVILDRIGLHGALQILKDKKSDQHCTYALGEVVDEKLVGQIGNLSTVEGFSLTQELVQARRVANRFGLYDASDLILKYVENMESKPSAIGMR